MNECQFPVQNLGVQAGNFQHPTHRHLINEKHKDFPVFVRYALPLGGLAALREHRAAAFAFPA
jgi:hypothetical protein